jgi:hypothetical protein
MARTASTRGVDELLRLLVAYRLLVYLGGLIAIGTPLALAVAFGVEVSTEARYAIVTASLGLMVATYVGERRVGLDHVDDRTGEPEESYPLGMRAAVLLAVVGVAVGVYLALRGSPIRGLLFVAGALLFAQFAYSHDW